VEADNLLRALSGVPFIISGIAFILNLKLLPTLDFRTAMGVAIMVLGAAVLLGASPKTAMLLALSSLTLLLSISSTSFNFTVEKSIYVKGNLSNCSSFVLKASMSKVEVMSGEKAFYEGWAPKSFHGLSGCKANACCSNLKISLGRPKEVTIESDLGSVNGELNHCIEKLTIISNMGKAELVYDVPPNCSGEIKAISNTGTVLLTLRVPQGTKVVYDTKSNLGTAKVIAPKGLELNGGKALIKVTGISNVGTVVVRLERK